MPQKTKIIEAAILVKSGDRIPGTFKNPANIYNNPGRKIGSVHNKKIVGGAGKKVPGTTDKNGFVRNAENTQTGSVEYETGMIRDHRNIPAEFLHSEDTVRNASGKKAGTCSPVNNYHTMYKTATALLFFDDIQFHPAHTVYSPKIFLYEKTGSAKGSPESGGAVNGRPNSLPTEDGSAQDTFENP